MRITFSDGTTGVFQLHHHYTGETARIIAAATEVKGKYLEIICQLKVLGQLSQGAHNPALIEWVEEQLRYLKGTVSEARNRPTKTICSLEWFFADGILRKKVEALSKISNADAAEDKHNRRIGREAAIRNLLNKLAEKFPYGAALKAVMPKQLRKELFYKLLVGNKKPVEIE